MHDDAIYVAMGYEITTIHIYYCACIACLHVYMCACMRVCMYTCGITTIHITTVHVCVYACIHVYCDSIERAYACIIRILYI
jgi:hypothetical protein